MPSLFEELPNVENVSASRKLYRRDGPETSRMAAEAIVESLPDMQARALALVTKYPNKTASELCWLAEIADPRVVNRRLSELRADGRIAAAGHRKCSLTGHSAETWVAVK